MIGGVGTNDKLVLESNSTDHERIEVSYYGLSVSGAAVPPYRQTIHQASGHHGVAIVGQGSLGGPSSSTDGVAINLAYNAVGNRQLVIGATDGRNSATGRFARLVFGTGLLSFDAVNGLSQRAAIIFGNTTANVTFGADAEGPSDAKSFFGGEASKKTAVFRTATSQTANAIEVQSPAGARLSGVGPNGAILNAVFTDAARPAAGIAGRVIYNSDDGNLNIDTGSQWVTPDGTIT